MLAGHLAVGLAFKARYRNVPTWALLCAAILLDGLWILLTFLRVEHYRLFLTLHGELGVDWYGALYSHALFWSAFYALIVFLLFVRAEGRRHWAVPLSLAVFSHWLLDWLIAEAALPFANFGPHWYFGLGLGNIFPRADFILEGIIALAGWWIYNRQFKIAATKSWPRGAILFVLLVLWIVPLLLYS